MTRLALSRTVRGIHRGLAPLMLLILAFWGTSGIYFAAYDLYLWYEYRTEDPDALRREGTAVLTGRSGRRLGRFPVTAALERADAAARAGGLASPVVRSIAFRWVGDRPLYELAFDGAPHFLLLDGDTGELLSPVTPKLAGAIAVDALGHAVPIRRIDRRETYSFHYFRSAAYRSGAPRDGYLPYYLVWLGDRGRTLVVVSEASGQVLLLRDWPKRLYWYGYWFLHTYLFHPSGVGQLASDLLLLMFGSIAIMGAATGTYLFLNYRRLGRRSRRGVNEWRHASRRTESWTGR